jgi:hypothetical protein
MMRIGTLLLAGGLFTAAPLAAQTPHQHGGQGSQHGAQGSHQHGAQADGSGMHCPMHEAKHGAQEGQAGQAGHGSDAVHRYAPKMLLEHRDMLQLTPQQVERFEALQAQHKADCQARMARVKAAEEAAAAALQLDTPDVQLFETKSREAANLKVDCKVDMVRTGQLALAALTAEQRAHLAHMNHSGH